MLLQSCTLQIHTGTTITGRLHNGNIKSTGPNSSRPISKCSAVKAHETGFNFTCQHTRMNLSFHLGHQGKPGRTNDSIKTDWTITCGQIEGHGTLAVHWKTEVKIKPRPCIQRFHSNRFVFFFPKVLVTTLCTIGNASSFSNESFQTRQDVAEGVKRLQTGRGGERWRQSYGKSDVPAELTETSLAQTD